MPTYYFHLRSARGVHPDLDGVRLPDAEAVRREAIDRALIQMQEGEAAGEDRAGWSFHVRDDADEPVLDLPFAEAIPQG